MQLVLAASLSQPTLVYYLWQASFYPDRYGCAVGDSAAAGSTPDVEQQHVCFLFQKVLLRGLDDGLGSDRNSSVYTKKRR